MEMTLISITTALFWIMLGLLAYIIYGLRDKVHIEFLFALLCILFGPAAFGASLVELFSRIIKKR